MKKCFLGLISLFITAAIFSGLFADSVLFAEDLQKKTYDYWNSAGKRAGNEFFELMKRQGFTLQEENLVALTNAGYAEISGSSTMGFIDGLSETTGCKRGKQTLVEIHARYDAPLWCSVYDKTSGYCVYLQFKSDILQLSEDAKIIQKAVDMQKTSASAIFDITSVEKIDATHLYANAEQYNKKFKEKIFGGNEFRIVTIINALAKGAPSYALRAFEYHDHYCPGVTSGIVTVNYIRKNFPPVSGGNYFVQSVQPWCKEDALMTLLNVTPGKGGYSVIYSTEADRANWREEARDASTIVYRENRSTGRWDGVVLGFKWIDSGCKDFGKKSIITKLCTDLWYLERLDQADTFIKVIKRFELPDGLTPKDWARPGVDPMEKLGLIQN